MPSLQSGRVRFLIAAFVLFVVVVGATAAIVSTTAAIIAAGLLGVLWLLFALIVGLRVRSERLQIERVRALGDELNEDAETVQRRIENLRGQFGKQRGPAPRRHTTEWVLPNLEQDRSEEEEALANAQRRAAKAPTKQDLKRQAAAAAIVRAAASGSAVSSPPRPTVLSKIAAAVGRLFGRQATGGAASPKPAMPATAATPATAAQTLTTAAAAESSTADEELRIRRATDDVIQLGPTLSASDAAAAEAEAQVAADAETTAAPAATDRAGNRRRAAIAAIAAVLVVVVAFGALQSGLFGGTAIPSPLASAAPSLVAQATPTPVPTAASTLPPTPIPSVVATASASVSAAPSATQVLPVPVITVTPSTRVINLGDVFLIQVHFATNGAGKTVTLQSQPGSVPADQQNDDTKWEALATLTTDGAGNATYTDKPPDSRFYRVSFAGSADLAPGVSERARALVRQIHLLTPSNNGRTVAIARGTVIAFTSTVEPARPLLPAATVTFVVYELIKGSWGLIASEDVTIDQAGHAAFSYAFAKPGSFYVRSVARPTVVNANSIWTPVNRYDVT